MIGTTLRYKSGTSLGAVLSLLAALGLVLLGATEGHDETLKAMLLAAFWPFSLAIVLFILRRGRFQAEFKENFILVTQPHHEEIPYASIKAVQSDSNGKKDRRAIFVHHAERVLKIPDKVGVKSSELLEFLKGFVPPGERDQLPVELQHHLDAFSAKFGAERVFAFTPRHQSVRSKYGQFGRALGLSCVITGTVWAVVSGFLHDRRFNSEGWISSGLFLIFIGLILFMLFSMLSRLTGGQKKWKSSGLVISPLGLSLIQGKMRGEMKWEELKKLIYPTKKQFFDVNTSNRVGNIRLDFGGGGVDIFDIYCHPLEVVHGRMKAYWKE